MGARQCYSTPDSSVSFLSSPKAKTKLKELHHMLVKTNMADLSARFPNFVISCMKE